MSDLIKYVAIGAVGFIGYEMFIKPMLNIPVVAPVLAPNIAPANASASNITNMNIGILQKLFNISGGNTTLYTYDQWNFYYNKLTGSYAKSWEDTALSSNGISRDKTLTGQQFLTANAIDAMSGLGAMQAYQTMFS